MATYSTTPLVQARHIYCCLSHICTILRRHNEASVRAGRVELCCPKSPHRAIQRKATIRRDPADCWERRALTILKPAYRSIAAARTCPRRAEQKISSNGGV